MSENKQVLEWAKQAVSLALKAGAQQAEAFAEWSQEASCRVRDGAVEDVTQAASRGLGLRVLVNRRLGFAWTSDVSKTELQRLAQQAVALAKAAAPHPANALPSKFPPSAFAALPSLMDPSVESIDPEWKLRASLEMERAGRAVDPRIKTFESVGAGEYLSQVALASSEGIRRELSGSTVYLYASPVAAQGTQLQTSHWGDAKRFLSDLESPESVGKEAARRALRMLDARPVKSQEVPVIFDPSVAASFVGAIASAANGDAVYKKSSFWAGKLGQAVASPLVSVFDDGTLPKGLASTPFDGEGVPTRKTPLIEAGVLRAFLYDEHTARKAKVPSTGNAARSYRSLPHIGTHNLYLQAGNTSREKMIQGVKQGLYVTHMLGHGTNIVTGDYSRGVNGLWISDGELTFPVQEVTVAGNLLTMLSAIDAVGSDLEFRSSTASPSLRFSSLTVSGA